MIRKISLAVVSIFFIFSCIKTQKTSHDSLVKKRMALLDKTFPVKIVLWHYYNGYQKEVFDSFIQEFNNSKGAEAGVFVEAFGKTGNLDELNDYVMEAAEKKLGANSLPDIFSAYADTAYVFDRKGLLADIGKYLTEKEKREYVDFFWELPKNNLNGEIKVFPIAKATEMLVINKTIFETFANTCKVSKEELKTWENLLEVSKKYYEWTDSFTKKPNDGKSFFGRDAFANYILTGAKELDSDLFEISDEDIPSFNLNKSVFKKLWDSYYIPYVNGYFYSGGRFRSDDLKTGKIVACICSTAAALYLPKIIVDDLGKDYPVDLEFMPLPHFMHTKNPVVIQQGAGMAVIKSNEKKEAAAALFLKWFTDIKQNTFFSILSGYIPVKKAAASKENITKFIKLVPNNRPEYLEYSILEGINILNSSNVYFLPGVKNSSAIRKIIDSSMKNKAVEDRKKILLMIESNSSSIDVKKAISDLCTEDKFEEWFESFKTQIDNLN